jgi:hypothetical protein
MVAAFGSSSSERQVYRLPSIAGKPAAGTDDRHYYDPAVRFPRNRAAHPCTLDACMSATFAVMNWDAYVSHANGDDWCVSGCPRIWKRPA